VVSIKKYQGAHAGSHDHPSGEKNRYLGLHAEGPRAGRTCLQLGGNLALRKKAQLNSLGDWEKVHLLAAMDIRFATKD
jgi:hypothetical protein